MAKYLLCLFALLLAASGFGRQRTQPYPPGMIEIEQHPQQLEPPIGPKPTVVTHAQLQHDADELSRLAASIPTDVTQANQGVLSKDLLKKLKKIEKISKQLQHELVSK